MGDAGACLGLVNRLSARICGWPWRISGLVPLIRCFVRSFCWVYLHWLVCGIMVVWGLEFGISYVCAAGLYFLWFLPSLFVVSPDEIGSGVDFPIMFGRRYMIKSRSTLVEFQ